MSDPIVVHASAESAVATDPLRRELWGYGVWGTVLLVVLIPEVWAAASGQSTLPTISGTVGHLEYLRDWVGLVVAGVIVWVALDVMRYPSGARQVLRPRAAPARETPGGRPTIRAAANGGIPALVLGVGVAVVATGGIVTSQLTSDLYVLGYVVYGLIALFCAALPNVVAFLWARDVPFPTFFRTLANLELRAHFVSVLVVVGLVILLIHLAFYPWPNVFHVLKGPHPSSP